MTDLILDIREFLHDPDKDRWTDSTILRQINKAQLDIAKKARVLKKHYQVGTRVNKSIYSMPADFYELTRVELNNCSLRFVSYADRDKCGCSSCGKGIPKYVLIDKQVKEQIIICPAPATTDTVEYEATTLYGLHTINTDEGIYGVTTNLVSDIEVSDIEVIGYPLGILREVLNEDLVLKIYYIALPKYLDSIHDELEIDEEIAIKHYVCGHLLRSDKDSNSRSLGQEELMLYQGELTRIASQSSRNFTDGNHVQIKYRGI